MKLLLLFLSVFLILVQSSRAECDVASQTVASGSHLLSSSKICSGDLIFEDNFDTFDLSRWNHESTLGGGGNWEFEWYLNNRTNSFAKDGNLHIKPTLLTDDYGEDFIFSGTLDINGCFPVDECTNAAFYGCSRTGSDTNALNPIKSARIRTVDSFTFKYGTIEVKAKLPSGDWLWPAIWLVPRYNNYGTWPASGEIDIMESRGNKDLVDTSGVNVGAQQVSHTLHWAPSVATNQWNRTHFEKNNAAGYDTDFHVYKMEWTSEGIKYFIDDEATGTITPPDGGFWELGEFDKTSVDNPWAGGSKMAPFDQEFYLIINLAVGGVNFFSDDFINAGGKPWSNTSPTAPSDFWKGKSQWIPTWNMGTDDSHLIIDYVRVYAA
ncbi:beta-1,3-glucan-binding protein-like [Euwallacea similis]|uniref:beta-1,3-glucan-binding protein-like n=1 Tax=Euwallacea similis TaxID=1736056 RepID=UPI00344EA31C